jgi:hypothetical protein
VDTYPVDIMNQSRAISLFFVLVLSSAGIGTVTERDVGSAAPTEYEAVAQSDGAAISSAAPASERQVEGGEGMDSPRKTQNASAENLDPILVRLIDAADKDEFAERNGMEYRNGSVLVMVNLEEGATMPQNYNVSEEMNYTGQGENLAQAYVPAGNLRPLSNESGVERVRLPMSSESLQKNGENETGETESLGTDVDEEPESSETRENQGMDGSETRGKGLSSVMGGVLATLIIILTAAYARRKL